MIRDSLKRSLLEDVASWGCRQTPIYVMAVVTTFWAVCDFSTAATLKDDGLGQEASQSSWIGRLRIDSITTVSTQGFPVSRITATLVEVLKGSGQSGESLSFEVPGGRDNKVQRAILGFPKFREGHEFIVFLDRDPRESSVASSRGQAQLSTWSAFRVVPSSDEGEAVVIRSGDSTLLQTHSTGFQLMHDRGMKSYGAFVDELYRALD